MASIVKSAALPKYICIFQVPVKPLKVDKVVRSGAITVLQDAKGKLYSPSILRNTWFNAERMSNKLPDLFAALCRLQVITREEMEQDKKHRKLVHEKYVKTYAATDLVDGAAKLGLKLTKAQLAKLEPYLKIQS